MTCGASLRELMALIAYGTIRILDAEFIVKDAAGNARKADAAPLGEPDGTGIGTGAVPRQACSTTPTSSAGMSEWLAQLAQLSGLKNAGVLTDAEFDEQKAASSTADRLRPGALSYSEADNYAKDAITARSA
jgi:hypothetical protein